MTVDQLIRVLQQYPSNFMVTDEKFHSFTTAKEIDRTDPLFPKDKTTEDIILTLF